MIAVTIGFLSCPLRVDAAPRDSSYKARPHLYAGILGMVNVAGNVMPSNQIQMSLGLNIGRLAKRNFVLAPMIELNGFKVLGTNRRYDQLADAVQENYILQSNPVNAARGTLMLGAFSTDTSTGFLGCYMATYGIAFSPFPDHHGGWMLQLKRGTNGFPISNFRHNPNVSHPNDDWIVLNVPIQYRVQVLCKPLTFLPIHDASKPHFLREHLILSLAYDRTSLRKATLDGAPLTRFLKPAFMNEYGGAGHLTLGVGIATY